jgi:hypothetical protein
MCHQSHQSIFLYFIRQYIFPFEFLSIFFLAMPSIKQINFSCLKNNEEKKQQVVIDGGGSSLLDLSLFSLSLLTIHEWRDYHWQNDTVILSLVHLIT